MNFTSPTTSIQEDDLLLRYLANLETPETIVDDPLCQQRAAFSYRTFKTLAERSPLTGLFRLVKHFGTRSLMMGCLLSFLHGLSLGSSQGLGAGDGASDDQLLKLIALDWHVYSYHCRTVNSHFVLWSDVVAGRQSSERKKISDKKPGGIDSDQQRSTELSDAVYYSRVYRFWGEMVRDHLRILFDARPELLYSSSPSIRQEIASMHLEKMMILSGFSGTDNLTLNELLGLIPPSYLEAIRTLACLRSIGCRSLVMIPNEILFRILTSFLPL